MTSPKRADYGIDAPGVVRNLLLIGIAALLLWLSATVHLWSGKIPLPIPGQDVTLDLTGTGLVLGVLCLAMAAWMLWDSKVGKYKSCERLLDRITWRGDEQVLDVGCGRGLRLMGAARRLTSGTATGIDIWQTEDLSGNRRQATLDNAAREGVSERVKVESANMRRMPFAPESFDVVVSRAAIHNLYQADDRLQALQEIVRVLRKGGYALIDDIRHIDQYAKALARLGCSDIKRYGSRFEAFVLMLITWGSLRPGVLVVRKDP
ncbi:MAG: class I SAM-dependent methyltransferase [Steroidobacteraceae bacterium]